MTGFGSPYFDERVRGLVEHTFSDTPLMTTSCSPQGQKALHVVVKGKIVLYRVTNQVGVQPAECLVETDDPRRVLATYEAITTGKSFDMEGWLKQGCPPCHKVLSNPPTRSAMLTILKDDTRVAVIDRRDGACDECSLASWHRSMVGGSRWEDYEIVILTSESRPYINEQVKKYQAIAAINKRLLRMTPDEVQYARTALGVGTLGQV